MPDDKGGMKDNLRDEFNKATGKDKKKDDKDKNKDSEGGTKENVRDEFDEATGKDKKDS